VAAFPGLAGVPPGCWDCLRAVTVKARDGNVTLTGTVGYGVQRQESEDTIAALTGVRNIKNEIEISTDADPVDVTVHVQDALDRS